MNVIFILHEAMFPDEKNLCRKKAMLHLVEGVWVARSKDGWDAGLQVANNLRPNSMHQEVIAPHHLCSAAIKNSFKTYNHSHFYSKITLNS